MGFSFFLLVKGVGEVVFLNFMYCKISCVQVINESRLDKGPFQILAFLLFS